MSLKGKVACVTGGSRGIGRAIALELARAGATVCITFHKQEAPAREVLKSLQQISSLPHRMAAFDVADAEAVNRGLRLCLEKLLKIDILVNNAGVVKDNLLLRMREAEWDEVIGVNLKSVFNCSKGVVKQMLKQRWGRIINISSLSGTTGNAGQSNYAASKAGMIGFTKSLARELASRGITVNAVAPGFIETEMTEAFPQERKSTLCRNIPLGRFGSCEEVAHLVVFLASDRAAYITGQVIGVNGGLYM